MIIIRATISILIIICISIRISIRIPTRIRLAPMAAASGKNNLREGLDIWAGPRDTVCTVGNGPAAKPMENANERIHTQAEQSGRGIVG